MSGGATEDGALLVYMSADSAPPFQHEVHAQLYEATGAGGAVVGLGGGCGGGGAASAVGSFAVGSTDFAFLLTGAAGGTTGVAYLALGGTGAPISCGPCTVTLPIVTLGAPLTYGGARLDVPVPCVQSLISGAVEAQWWVVAPSGCTLAPDLSFSNRLQATVGE
ncbi:MAG: hypothetical protein AAF628_23800 [Planctomycetota bacterium]